jgi:signal transduction histidine kinase
VIPGIILGYLAFRGLRNDQALREKQERQELQLMAGEIWKKLDEGILDLKSRLEEGRDPFGNSVLISWVKKPLSPPVIRYAQMIYRPEGSLEEGYESSLASTAEAKRLEFSSLDYQSAIGKYRELIELAGDERTKLDALMGLARVYKKSGNNEGAEQTYRAIAEKCPAELISGQLPACGLSLLEIIKLQKEGGDSLAINQTSGEFLEFIMHPPVQYEKSAFEYLFTVWESFNIPPGEYRDQLNQAKQKTEQLATWHDMSPGLFTGDDKTKYLESTYLPAIFIQSAKDSISRAWALDLGVVLNNIIPGIIDDLDDTENLGWSIKTNIPGLVLGDTLSNPVDLGFPASFPPWKLQLERHQQGGLKGIFKTSQGVLILVFAFIIILMIAGLAFMLTTLNQEMKLSRMKSTFISNVSHEFKTPLTSIRHMTEIMHLKRIDSEERKEEYLQSMLEQCDHLGHLVDNILDFSRIEEDVKNYRFELHRLDQILEDLVPVFRSRISDDSFEIELHIENPIPEMMLDKDAMLQVFFNLLDNAYKYGMGSKRIEIDLKAQGSRLRAQVSKKDELNVVLIAVKDHGMGMSEKDQARIFERFYRGDKLKTAGIKGSGIGLTIVKRIVEAHGGRIEVESELKNGSTFRVILPVNTKAL